MSTELNWYDILNNTNFAKNDKIDEVMSTFSVEARNLTTERAIRIQTQKCFVGERSFSEPVLIFSFMNTYNESFEVFKKIATRKSCLMVSKLKAYYMPRIINLKPSGKILRDTGVIENSTLAQLRNKIRPIAAKQKITMVLNDKKMIKKEYSSMIDMSYYIAVIEAKLKNARIRNNTGIRKFLLDTFKSEILSFNAIDNKVLFFKSPFLKGTNINTNITDMQLLSLYHPLFLFLEWMRNDMEDFKKWMKDNKITLYFENDTGNKYIALSYNDAMLNHAMFTFKIILRLFHMLDKTKKIIDDDTGQEIIIEEDLEPLKEESIDVVEKEIVEFEELDKVDEADESISSATTKDEEGFKVNKIREDIDVVIATITDEESSIIPIELKTKKTNIAKYDEIVKLLESDDKNSSIELNEYHALTKLRNTTETPTIERIRKNLLDKATDKVSVMANIKKHQIKKRVFDNPHIHDYSENSYIDFDNLYDKNLKNDDLETILNSPLHTVYPLIPISTTKAPIETREFYGYTLTQKYQTAEGHEIEVVLDIPELNDKGNFVLNGSEIMLQNQVKQKPIIKTKEDVIIATSYNKIILSLDGKYGSYKDKTFVKLLDYIARTIVNKNKWLIHKTTSELGSFILNNYVSYTLIHLCRMYVGIQHSSNYLDIKMDFRGISKYGEYIKNNEHKYSDITYMGTYNGKSIIHNPDDDTIIFIEDDKEYTFSTVDFILRIVDKILKDSNEDINIEKINLSNVTKSDVNGVYVNIMKRYIPVILLMCIAEPFNSILERLKKDNNLEYKIVNNNDDKLTESLNKLSTNPEYAVIKLLNQTVVIKYNNILNEIILNPLLEYDLSNYDVFDITKLVSEVTENNNSIIYMENFVDTFVDDHGTKRILDSYNIPSDFVGMLIYACSLYASYKTTSESDSINLRLLPKGELINNVIYDVLCKEGLSKTIATMKRGSIPKLNIPRDAVIRKIQELPTVSIANPISPYRTICDRLTFSTKGHVGINEERAYSMDRRLFHKNNLGMETMYSAYSANSGIKKGLPYNPMLTDLTGAFSQNAAIDLQPSNMLSFVESTNPYLIYDSPPRIIMANGQHSHVMGILGGMPLLVSYGADETAIHMSPEFSFKAKEDGTIIDISDTFIKVKYKSGKIDFTRIDDIIINTDKGFPLKNDMVVDKRYKIGDKFKSDDILAYNEQFFKYKTNGALGLVSGLYEHILYVDDQNTWEDACVIYESMSNALSTKMVKRVARRIPLNTELKYNHEVTIGSEVAPDTILYSYNLITDNDVMDKYFSVTGTDIGIDNVYAKHKGILNDIKIYYRSSTSVETSPSIRQYLSHIRKMLLSRKHMGTIANEDKTKMNMTKATMLNSLPQELTKSKFSKINGEEIANGEILIEYYIEYIDSATAGDKVVVGAQLKQEVSNKYPDELRPIGIETGRRPSIIINTYSAPARMVTSVILEGLLNMIIAHICIINRKILGIVKKDLFNYKSCRDYDKR